MQKAIVQYKFPGLVTPPEDEDGGLPYFLADYMQRNLDKARIVHVAPYSGPEAHICDLADDEGTYIDIIAQLDEEYVEEPALHHKEINRSVSRVLEESSFIVDEQVQCLNERFFTLEPYGKDVDG